MAKLPYLLILDDDPDDLDFFREAFLAKNPAVNIIEATKGEELLSFLIACSTDDLPAVVLLDYQMPGLNGREVLEALQGDTRYKGIVKVMWSTSQLTKDMEDCKKLGASHYLIKPSSVSELENVIQQITAILDYIRP